MKDFMNFKGNTIYHTDDLVRLYKYYDQGHYFDESTMKFFSSRITSFSKSKDGALYFITSERKGFQDYTRVFSLRKAYVKRGKIQIDTVGEFGEFETLYQAKRAMKEATQNYHGFKEISTGGNCTALSKKAGRLSYLITNEFLKAPKKGEAANFGVYDNESEKELSRIEIKKFDPEKISDYITKAKSKL